jgi:hypothetical protein
LTFGLCAGPFLYQAESAPFVRRGAASRQLWVPGGQGRRMEQTTKDGTIVAIACLEALALAEDRGIAKLIVVSDCLNVY